MKIENKKIPTISIVLLALLIIIGTILLILPSFVGVEEKYSLLIDPSITLEELNRTSSNLDILQLSLTNSNPILPNRVEVDDIVLCVFNSANQNVILAEELDTSSYQINRGSDVFNLQNNFVDIPSNSTINVIYSARFYGRQLIDALKEVQEIDYNYNIEFRAVDSSTYRYNYGTIVCRGEEEYEIISLS